MKQRKRTSTASVARLLGAGVLTLTLISVSACHPDNPVAPQVAVRTPEGISSNLSNGVAANTLAFPGSAVTIEGSGEFEELPDVATSRCPDELSRGGIYFNRTFTVSVIDRADPSQTLRHFDIDLYEMLFMRYTSRGWPVSYAEFRLTVDKLSNDLAYQANVGAIVLVNCLKGTYSGRGRLRLYKGDLRLEDIGPVYSTGLGGNDTENECDDPMTDEIETTCPNGASGPIVSGSARVTSDPGIDYGGTSESVWACYYTDWYVSIDNGATWEYDGTTSDGCYLEAT